MTDSVVTYRLSEVDFVAFNRYILRRRRGAFLLNALGTGLTLGLMLFLALRFENHDVRASLICGAVLAVFMAALMAYYYHSQIPVAVAKQVKANPVELQDRIFSFSEQGVRERSTHNDSSHAWEGLDSVGITLFLHTTAVTAYIVPRAIVSTEFVAVVRAHIPGDRIHDLGA